MRKITKKLLAFVLAALMVFGSAPLSGIAGIDWKVPEWLNFNLMKIDASALTEGIYTYTVSNGKATITDCDDTVSGDISIPMLLGGYPVTNIGDFAFKDCTGLTSVTIPNSVTIIGGYAFRNCSGLTSVTIPESITNIGDCAFYQNTALNTVNFNAVNCTYMGWVIESESFPTIDKSVFIGCTALYEVNIGSNVTSLPSCAFYKCSGLTNVIIPDKVISIGNYAFSFCSGLTSVTIPEGVTSIGHDAFFSCKSLTNVMIPNSLTSIGDWAFGWCEELASITIPASVTNIGSYPFYACKGPNINVDSNNSKYSSENGVLYNKTKTMLIQCLTGKMGALSIPDSVTRIEPGAFGWCKELTSVTIPDSMISIGDAAFAFCRGLTSVIIPNSVTSIGKEAFSSCIGLSSLTISNSVTSIGKEAFSSCIGLTSLTIPVSVTSIGNRAFFACTSLQTVNFNAINCEYMGTDEYPVFKDCAALQNVDISIGVTKLPNYAFYNCWRLTSVTIPDSVTNIGNSAFYNCNNLTIYGRPDSYAHIYANTNGIPFLPLIETEGLYLLKQPSKTNYLFGEPLDFTGLELVYMDSDLIVNNVLLDDCVISGYNPNMLGEQTVNIIYLGQIVSFTVLVLEVFYPESDHPYANNTNKTWTYSHPQPADYLEIKFSSETFTESGYDYIYLYDATNAQIGKYSGTALAGQTITVPGNSFSIKLTSDGSVTGYGFSIDSIIGIVESIITPAPGSDCVVDNEQGFLYGFSSGITKSQFEEKIQINGNYTIEYSTEILGTGTEVYIVDNTLKSTGTVIATFTIIIFGDVNGDGQISSLDALMTLQNASGLVDFNGVKLFAGDVNNSGDISSLDALKILQFASGLIAKF